MSDTCRDFLNQVFKLKPEERPTAFDLLDHPFIKGNILSESNVLNTFIDSPPSLSCLDMDSTHMLQLTQSQTGIKIY